MKKPMKLIIIAGIATIIAILGVIISVDLLVIWAFSVLIVGYIDSSTEEIKEDIADLKKQMEKDKQ